MDGTHQITANRRDVMKAAGGAAATAAVGSQVVGSAAADHGQDETGIKVNQVGYPTEVPRIQEAAAGTYGEGNFKPPKVAILTSAGMDVSSVSSFEVQDAETGESVYTNGTVSSAFQDEHGTQQTVKYADFTDFDEAGEYVVAAGGQQSRSFRIGHPSDLYKELLRDVGRLYTLKRSNTAVDDPHTGLSYGPGHTQDEEAIVAQASFLQDLSAGDTISVPTGWYDAGDYGKYVNPQAVSAAQLLLAYDRNPDAFHAGQFYGEDAVDDPDWGTMPDVLVECKQALQFLLDMQRPNGALFYKLAAKNWPAMDEAPEDDDRDRYVFGNSSVGTAHGAAAMALGARVYQGHDDQFASDLLSAAESAYDWLDQNRDVVWELSDGQNGGSGAYGRQDTDSPDRYWALAELYRTTGDSQYDDDIQNWDLSFTPPGATSPVDLPGDVEAPIDWNNPIGLANLAYYEAGGTLAGTSDTDGAAGGLTSSVWIGQKYTGDMEDQPADYWKTGVYDYYWGHLKSGISRSNQGIWSMETYVDMSTENAWIFDDAATDHVLGALHHALGRSPTGYSYVTGHGERSTMNPHDRIVYSQGMDNPIPGMLIGGPHNNLWTGDLEGDLTSDHIDQGASHLMSYYDHVESYATNEWAINYTAPLFLMLADVVGEITSTPEPDYDIQVGGTAPDAPSNLTVVESTSTSATVSWDAVSDADSYHVHVDDTYVKQTSSTEYTATGLDLDNQEHVIEVHSENSAGTSDRTSITVGDGGGGGGWDSPLDIGDGTEVCDVNGDDVFRDVNCDGKVSHYDVVEFFKDQHNWPYHEAVDLTGSNDIDHADVVELFEYVARRQI